MRATETESKTCHKAFVEDGLHALQIKKLHITDDEEKALYNSLINNSLSVKDFEVLRLALLKAKAGTCIKFNDVEYKLPKKWQPKPRDIFGFGDHNGAKLYNILKSEVSLETLLGAEITPVLTFIDNLEALLKKGEDTFEKFIQLTRWLSDPVNSDVLRKLETEEHLLQVKSWLRSQVARVFYNATGMITNTHNFKEVIDKIPEENVSNVLQVLCEDYIYRYVLDKLVTFELRPKNLDYDAQARQEKLKEMLGSPDRIKQIFSFGTEWFRGLAVNLINSDQMPYAIFHVVDWKKCKLSDIKREDLDPSFVGGHIEGMNDKAAIVAFLLEKRVKEFGCSNILENLTFDEFYDSRRPKSEVVVAPVASTADTASVAPVIASGSTHEPALASEERSKEPSETKKVSTTPAEENDPRSVKPRLLAIEWHKLDPTTSDIDDAVPPVKQNHPTKPWKKILIGLGALIGAGIGAAIGFPVVVAMVIAAGIGFVAGAFVGLAIPKLVESYCGRRAKQPGPVVADNERREPVDSATSKRNTKLDLFHKNSTTIVQPVSGYAASVAAPTSFVAGISVPNDYFPLVLEPKSPRCG